MLIIHNFLDKSFQNMLLPFQCIQHMFFLSNFSIKCNCIRTPTVNYYVVSLIGTLGFISLQITRIFFGYLAKYSLIIKIFNIVQISVIMSSNFAFYCINILKRNDSVQMVLNIQSALRVIYYKHYKMFTIGNWITVSLHFVFYFIMVSLMPDLWIALYLYSFLYFNVNIIYGIRIIALLRDGMKTWISEVEYYGKLCLELEEAKYNDNLEKLLQAYIDLMEAFDILKDILKFSVKRLYMLQFNNDLSIHI